MELKTRLTNFLKYKILILITSFFGGLNSGLLAQDSTAHKTQSFLAVPLIYYSPETRLGFGAAGIYSFHMNNEVDYRPSSIQFLASYTQNKQILIQLPYQLFWDRNKNYSYGELDYFKFPYQFYGIGNDISLNEYASYTATFTRFRLNYLRLYKNDWFVGVRYWFDNVFDITRADHPLFNDPRVVGINGGRSAGLGLVILFDTRDNVFYPSKGSYVELDITGYGRATLSNYSFSNYIIDARKYHEIQEGTIVAFQGLTQFSSGDVPFSELATIGGNRRMRGYYEGAVQDKNLFLFQTELRQTIKGRVGLVAFGGISNVFPRIQYFDFGDTRFTGGVGFRLMFNKAEKINARLDWGFGNKTNGIYFTISEAF